MNIKINKEQPNCFDAINKINNLAFGQPQEARLIKSLRKLGAYIPELSLIGKWKIKCPWEVPDEAWMAIELKVGVLEGKAGKAVFPKEYEEAV